MTASTTEGQAPRDPVRTGLVLMVGAAFWFSVMSALVKLAGARIPSMQIVLARAVVTLVLSIFMLRHAGIAAFGTRRRLLLLRGLSGFTALSLYYMAVVSMPLAEATTIHHTSPIFVAVFAWALLREPVGGAVWIALFIGLTGVTIVARPAALVGVGLGGLPPLAVLAALGGAVFTALAYVAVRRLSGTEHPLVIVFYFPLVSVPLSLPFAIHSWVWPTTVEWLALLGVGVSTQIAQVMLTWALKRERAGRATAVGYLQVVFAIGWGLILFGEVPGVPTLVGACLVLVSTAVVALGR